MASLNLAAVVKPNAVRKETLGVATHARLVILPTNMSGVKGSGGLTIAVFPVATALYWVSPDETQPGEDDVYGGALRGYAPAGAWTSIPWSQTHGDPAAIALFSDAGAQVVYVAISPARVPA